MIAKNIRKPTLFEKLLLVVGIAVGLVGFWLIKATQNQQTGLTWEFLTAIFLWLLLIFVIILTDSNESIKEELSIIIKEHIEETRLLKEEIKLMRGGTKKKKK
ncbi:hypothetical protein ISS07_02320 [Candidatus Woesearchaeota archaeon]|nr:hypothetical protein [Candidatus Woesearchaeota archaeon]